MMGPSKKDALTVGQHGGRLRGSANSAGPSTTSE